MTTPGLLGGRYELGENLGYGGMAEVHRGHDTRLGRDVAVKILRSDLARDTGFQARFSREAQNSASLNHPSIVAIYDTGEEPTTDGTLPYIVMEYVEGRTLRDVLNAEGKLLPERALEITAEICSALEFSHRNGIVHRDIKPANVMLTRTGAVKVMDFGIARAVSQSSATMTQTSAVIGTAQYLSPEQARGETVDARSDIYSAGCVLYELLTGEPPFTGESPVSVAYQHVREDPVPPSERNPDVTADIDAIVLKSMAKNPANRYQSAAEMRADLIRAGAGRPVEATPVMGAAERTEIMGAAVPPTVIRSTTVPAPAEPSNGRRAWTITGLVVLLVAVLVAALFIGRSVINNDKVAQATVPQLVGQTQAAATAQLTGLGFKSKVSYVQQDDSKRGQVIDQSPPDGQKLDKGSTVTITVDQGKKRVQVPQLEGLSQASAQRALAEAQLMSRVVTQTDPDGSDAGTVFKASPASGDDVPIGTTVTLYVSDGKASVPSVSGKSADDAQSLLTQAGFQVNQTEQESSTVDAGTVISQSPSGGTKADRGSTVTIVVATAPPSPSPTPTPSSPSPSPSGSGGPNSG